MMKSALREAAHNKWPNAIVVAVNLKGHAPALPARVVPALARFECMLIRYESAREYDVYIGTSWRDVAAQARLDVPDVPTGRRAPGYYA
jgi:hypothetical protein